MKESKTKTRPKPKAEAKSKGAIIFLDIDGVLNGIETEDGKRIPNFKGGLDDRAFGFSPDLVANLRKVIDATDARIVVSSSWRHFREYFMDELRGVKPPRDWRELLAGMMGRGPDLFIGSTPPLSMHEYIVRGMEIKQWMKDNESKFGVPDEDYRFCIIDDEVTSILKVFDVRNVMHTNGHVGLTSSDADKVIHILKYS